MPRAPRPSTLASARIGRLALRYPAEAAWAVYEECGPVARVGFGPFAFTWMFGPAANELVLSSQHRNFTWAKAFRSLTPVDGPTALVVTDGEEHDRRRRLVQPAFAMRRIEAGVPVMIDEIDRAIDGLRPGSMVDFYGLARGVIRRIVTRLLFGESLAARSEEFGEALEPALRYTDRPPQLQSRMLPGYRPARRSRRRVDAIVDAEMARRRGTSSGDDVLGVLLESGLSAAEIRDQVVSLVAAGYDTTSATAAWVGLELLRNEGEWPKAADAAYATAAVNEALRLWPAASILARQTTEGFEIDGCHVEPGSMVIISPYVTHRLPSIWGDDAAAFRPDRWVQGEPAPHTYIPFGGTYRRCLGFALALAELRLIVSRLASRTSLTLLRTGEVRGTGIAALRPAGGVPVRVDDVRAARPPL